MDKKDFVSAMSDYDKCIEMMSTDGEDVSSGRAQYGEYPDTFVGNTPKTTNCNITYSIDLYHRESTCQGGLS